MSGITGSGVSASWQRGCGPCAPGVRANVVQPRLVGIRPSSGGESVGAYDNLPNPSYGHPLRGGRDRGKRRPSTLRVPYLGCNEGSYYYRQDNQGPSSYLAETVEHISLLLCKFFVFRGSPWKRAAERQPLECEPVCEN